MTQDITNMYGYDDDDTVPKASDPTINVIASGAMRELRIGGQTIQVIDPIYVRQLEMTVKKMEQRLMAMENEVRTMKGRTSNIEQGLRQTIAEMNNKVSYE